MHMGRVDKTALRLDGAASLGGNGVPEVVSAGAVALLASRGV